MIRPAANIRGRLGFYNLIHRNCLYAKAIFQAIHCAFRVPIIPNPCHRIGRWCHAGIARQPPIEDGFGDFGAMHYRNVQVLRAVASLMVLVSRVLHPFMPMRGALDNALHLQFRAWRRRHLLRYFGLHHLHRWRKGRQPVHGQGPVCRVERWLLDRVCNALI